MDADMTLLLVRVILFVFLFVIFAISATNFSFLNSIRSNLMTVQDDLAALAKQQAASQADLTNISSDVDTLTGMVAQQNQNIQDLKAQIALLSNVPPDIQTQLDTLVASGQKLQNAADSLSTKADTAAGKAVPPAAITMGQTSLPDAVVGQNYLQQLTAQGGTGALSFSSTTLPPGFSISSSGLLTSDGTQPAGTGSISVAVTDSAVPPVTQSFTFTLTVDAAP